MFYYAVMFTVFEEANVNNITIENIEAKYTEAYNFVESQAID